MDWKSHPPFCYLGESALETISDAMVEQSFKAGDIVFAQGDPGHAVYVIVSGKFEAFVSCTGLGAEHSVGEFGPGEIFGEITVLAGDQRLASIRCSEDGVVRELERGAFLSILENEPKAAVHLAVQLARILRKVSPLQGGVVFHDLDRQQDYSHQAGRIHRRISRLCRGMILAEDGHVASIAMVDPADANARDFLTGLVKPQKARFLAITEEDFSWYASRYLRETVDAAERVGEFPRLVYPPDGTVDATEENEAITRLHEALCLAIGTGASDLHLEPSDDGARIRLRIDGRLLECASFSKALAEQVVSRLKIFCELDITQRRLPQDGSMQVLWDGNPVDMRASFIPCIDGERVVLRMLGDNPAHGHLRHITHDPGIASSLVDFFSQPSGLILVTGPAGSGKTTTLYAALRDIWEQDHSINIVTIEDPVDRKLPFASQVQIDPTNGLTFANALRSLLRQDPDVILVGEIRDAESAEIAVQAAGTGHLVLSTLHTHSAFDAVSRMKKLSIEPWMLASVLKGVIAQRLVRSISPGQGEQRELSPKTLRILQKQGVLPSDFSGTLAHPCDADAECGRMAIFEILRVNADVRSALETDQPIDKLLAAAVGRDFVSFADYARSLILTGKVSPDRIAACFPNAGTEFRLDS